MEVEPSSTFFGIDNEQYFGNFRGDGSWLADLWKVLKVEYGRII